MKEGLTLDENEKVTMLIKGTASTGYRWTDVSEKNDAFKVVSNDYVDIQPKYGEQKVVGAPGEFQMVIMAGKAGTTGQFKIVNKRSWEKGEVSEEMTRTFPIHIVDEKVEMEDDMAPLVDDQLEDEVPQ